MAPVSGSVMFDGKPIPHAMVTFFPDQIPEGKLAFAMTDETGKFASVQSTRPGDGAVVGQHRVTVTESWPPGKEIPTTPDGMQLPPPRGPWPAKFRDSAGSPLKVEVKSKEKNQFDFNLSN